MARHKKTASSLKKQAKKSRSDARKNIRASKRISKPSKAAAKQTKRQTKKFQRQVIRGLIKPSTRKLPKITKRLKKRSVRRIITTGPRFSFNIFAPIQNLTKPQATKIKRRISRAKEPARRRQRKADLILEKEARLKGLERSIDKRREWLIDIGQDPDLADDVKRSARRKIRAELDRLIKSMERVERDLFKRYGAKKNAANNRAKGSPKPQGKASARSPSKATRKTRK